MNQNKFYKNRIIALIILAVLSFFISVISILEINKNINLNRDVSNIIVLSQKVRYYDEVLTMSSRMALYQDTLYWNNRYYKNVRKLDEVINQIVQNMPIVKDKLDIVEKANVKLVKYEEEALKKAMNKEYEEARKLLFSKEYKDAKQVYQVALEEALTLLENKIKAIETNFDRNILLASIVALGFTVMIFLFSYYAFKYLVSHNKLLKKEVKKELEKSTKKDLLLIEQSKLASLGEMLENIAHQWRQPLSIISTSVSSLKLKKELDDLTNEDIDSSLESISNSSKHLSTTIDVFREFYKDDTTKQFNLKEMFSKAQTLLSSKFRKKGITVLDDFEDFQVIGRENEIVQVIMNILSNAIDELEKYDEEKIKVIKIETNKNEEFVSLTITDNAGGIESDIINKVFDYKFTTKKGKNGTGIGLYMSKLILEKSNGAISVINKEFEYKKQNYIGASFKLEMIYK